MQRFSKNNRCDKCGLSDVGAEFHGKYGSRCPTVTGAHPCHTVHWDTEHILRICKKCGFKWLEEPLDALSKQVAKVVNSK